jgi:hypothetical protein
MGQGTLQSVGVEIFGGECFAKDTIQYSTVKTAKVSIEKTSKPGCESALNNDPCKGVIGVEN